MRFPLLYIILFLFSAIPLLGFGQQKTLPLNRFLNLQIEQSVASPDSAAHTGMKPYLESRFELKNVLPYEKDSVVRETFAGRKIFSEHLLIVDEENFHLTVDPLFHFQYGYDFADETNYQDTVTLYENTRGFWVRGDITDKVSFQTLFYENQKFFPAYVKDFADQNAVVPGEGRYKEFKEAGYDFGYAYANVSYTPIEDLNFQMGHGKHFVGHGYRSLLLSDNAFAFPYIKATAWLWKDKIQYSYMYAQLESLQRRPAGDVPEALFIGKDANFYHVSFLFHPRLEFSLFESVMWNRYKPGEGTQPFHWQSTIPVLGVNSVILGLEDLNNSMLGADANFKVSDQFHVYGQFALDAFDYQEIGLQAGFKAFDIFSKNLHFQFEFNQSGRDLYYNDLETIETFTQQNQWLTYTLGPERKEVLAITNYRWNRLFAKAKVNLIKQHIQYRSFLFPDTPDQYRLIQNYELGYLINPSTNLNVSVGYLDRLANNLDSSAHTHWFYIRIGTTLQNLYYDF